MPTESKIDGSGSEFASLSDRIAEKCGEVSVGSSNIAGLLQGVIQSSEELGDKRAELVDTFERLEQDQRKAADASDEARELSRQGSSRLSQSIGLIETALGEISSLLELVGTLEKHIIGFAAALEQVRSSTSQIDQIADTTSILALNASIEAARAGKAGNSFSVVASEVKGLAADTGRATAEISATVEKFSNEARELIENIELGARTSRQTQNSVGQIEQTVSEVIRYSRKLTATTSKSHVRQGQSAGRSYRRGKSSETSKRLQPRTVKALAPHTRWLESLKSRQAKCSTRS